MLSISVDCCRVTVPVKVGLASGAFKPSAVVTVVAKLASSPNAAASSFSVSSASGAVSIKLLIAVPTNVSVARPVKSVAGIAAIASSTYVSVASPDVTTYPDTPASAGLSCAGVLPSPNILLIVANEGLLITGAMYELKSAYPNGRFVCICDDVRTVSVHSGARLSPSH